MSNNKKECDVVYLCIGTFISQKAIGKIISNTEVKTILGRTFHISKEYKQQAINKLCEMGLIKRISQQQFEVVG